MAEPLESSGAQKRRARGGHRVQRRVYISPAEWEQVARRMFRAGETNFSRFTRRLLLTGKVVQHPNVDVAELARQLSAIGNNLNQIAKKANTGNQLTQSMAESALRQFYQVRDLFDAVYGTSGYGSGESSQHQPESF